MQRELNRIAGALEVLELLRERLAQQLDELAGETAQEAIDTTLSYVASLQAEYQRRQRLMHPLHQPYLFLMDGNGQVTALPQEKLAALAKGEADAPELAGKAIRMADWYVRMRDNMPDKVVNETYQWLSFDAAGRLDLHAAHAIEESSLPTEAERMQMHALVFGKA